MSSREAGRRDRTSGFWRRFAALTAAAVAVAVFVPHPAQVIPGEAVALAATVIWHLAARRRP